MDEDTLRQLEAQQGPVLAAPPGDDGRVARRLERAWHRGSAVRLAPGRFCRTRLWAAAPPWDRATLSAVALQSWRGGALVFTGATAALLHGLWTAAPPIVLEARALTPGHRGPRPPARALAAPAAVTTTPSPLRRPPDLRFRTRAAWSVVEPPADVTALLSDGTSAGVVRVDSLGAVIGTVGACLPLSEVLPILDSAASRARGPFEERAAEQLVRAPTAAARRRLERALAHVEPASESAGESLSRGLIVELGFARPTVQRSHHDADGRFIGRTDFWWEEAGIAGEFDGVTKYDVGAHPDEARRRRAIRAEKERELALLRVVRALPRWTWSDLREPRRLALVLEGHGVPRAR